MDTARPASSNRSGLMRSITKIMRLRRAAGGVGNGISPHDDHSIRKVKFPEYFDGSSFLSQSEVTKEDEKTQLRNREAMESLLANLFASISAVKAAYAQLQVAQSPYDPESIQSADKAVVSELKRISQLKHAYLKQQFDGSNPLYYQSHQPSRDSQMLAEIQEQRNLLKTFQITTKKLESELQHKDSEVASLRDQLQETEKQNRSLEAKLHPKRSLSALGDLHPSGLNPTHFLTLLRYTIKSIRSFVKLMVHEMEACRWDMAAAAGSIEPDILRGMPEHRTLAFESYVCRKMFSDFQHHHFGENNTPLSLDRRRFFDEFVELKFSNPKQLLDRHPESPFGKFCRAKYLALVHPKMEAAFFGNLDHRALVSSGEAVPATVFFTSYAEMARRMWLLHRLFFSFGSEVEIAIFQVDKGCRFSEVYMESVGAAEDLPEAKPTVGFTVVPGFKVGKTVIQCKVYLARRLD